MQRFLTLIGILIAFAACSYAQTPQEIADKIRTQNDKYKWGEGRGFTEKEAKNAAICALMDNFRLAITKDDKSSIGYDVDTGGEESHSTTLNINSFMSLPNTETLYWEEQTADGNVYVRAFVYVSNEDIEKAAQSRREKIADRAQL